MKSHFLAALLFLSLTAAVLAGPTSPLRHENYEFRAVSPAGAPGRVEVWDTVTEMKVGEILLYRTAELPIMPTDTKWVRIRSMKLKWPMLTVVDSSGKVFKLRAEEYVNL